MKSIFLFLLYFTALNTTVSAEPLSEAISKSSLTESAFLRFLGPTILEIMETHGDNQLFMNEKIESITKNIEQDSYDVTIHIIGFEGPP
ncbi:hypothetical protein [Bacillus sp. B1-b2]|uniref:hypothetical protein n=1 Tax=Bacillus sp. B1-b2 TaxID=2653201 RepID=UPI0012625149|nr:hypothetical protein [Bacillus sp. B1-b2]KAB7670680.1 hypothetical protein F9279_07625 [Bacillus sp. B1-b2]